MFFIERYWPDCPWEIDIVTNTEKHRLLELPGNKIYVGDDLGLASNLIAYLDQLEDELVLLILDDYFLSKPPDTELLKGIVACMEAHENIGCVNLRPWSSDLLSSGSSTHFKTWMEWQSVSPDEDGRRGIKAEGCPASLGAYDLETAEYLLSLQPGLWRKDFLKSLLREREDGWETEIKGSGRARQARKWILGTFSHPLSYCNIARYGIWRANPDGSTSQDWIVEQVGTHHWVYKELSAALSGEGLR